MLPKNLEIRVTPTLPYTPVGSSSTAHSGEISARRVTMSAATMSPPKNITLPRRMSVVAMAPIARVGKGVRISGTGDLKPPINAETVYSVEVHQVRVKQPISIAGSSQKIVRSVVGSS